MGNPTKEDLEKKVKELEDKIIVITDEKTGLSESLKKALEEKDVLVIQVKDLTEVNEKLVGDKTDLQGEIDSLNFDIEALSASLENFKNGGFIEGQLEETPEIELKDKALDGLEFSSSSSKKDEKTGKRIWKSETRPLTKDDILSTALTSAGVVIVTKDGKKHRLPKSAVKA